MRKTIKMPDAFVILLVIAGLCYGVSHFILPGAFELKGTQEAVALSQFFQAQAPAPIPLFATQGEAGLFNVLFEGLVSGDRNSAAIGVIAFILITGGAFGVLMQTKAIDNGIMALINSTQRIDWLFIPCLFITFALGGAIFGMGEEAIAFCIVLYPIMQRLGYNAQVTVLVTYVATQIGFATSAMNPFSIAIAQSIAQLPVFSGAEFRVALTALFTLVGLVFTVRYAAKIRTNHDAVAVSTAPDKLALVDKALLLAFLLVIVWVIYGVTAKGYYIPELATQFFILGLVIAAIAKLGERQSIGQSVDAFKTGSAELLPAALLVGLAKGLVLLLGGTDLQTPSTLNTLLYYAATLITQVPDALAAWLMYVFQSLFNFFVSSGSGQAAITMPIMAPLSDLIGVSRQTAVLAFQLGDGLTNIIIPTSASLIGCLGVVKLSWNDWVQFIWRFMLLLFTLASVVTLFAQLTNYQ
ncbi:putative basic amino acid antiporter YfcC [Pseudoalteromonas sp. A757]|uniref:putative basic amino acid antiporter YfcC n=1 Tax=Pseudoalteromonas sp. A757 TaxID=2250709 RepID=UPI0014770AC9|nr:putative basic amino acid antiporter YfcC [Pseudoalteromonas sp. A757]